MSSFAIDGLISGLDTGALVTQLVAAESRPRNLLQARATTTQSFITALQSLNTKVASLAENAAKAVKAESWQAVKTASSDSAVATVTAGTGAQVGSVSFEVRSLAAAQVNIFDPAALGEAGALTISVGGEDVVITPDSSHPEDIVAAINSTEGLDIQATLVRVSGGEEPEYFIQLTGATGTANTFEVHGGTEAMGPPLTGSADAVTAAADAEIVLWAGSVAERTLTSDTNTFTGLLTGVDVTVAKVSEDPVTISATRNTDAQAKLITDMVSSMGVVLSDIASRTATSEDTDEDGNLVVTGGLFSGDSAIRMLRTQLQDAFTQPVNGQSPATVLGISISRTGEIEVDSEVLAESLAEDPEGTIAFAQALAERVHGAADAASDRYDGTLTQKITSQESLHRSLEQQVSAWDVRIEKRQSMLLAQFAAMEVTLSQLQNQSNWLASQLTTLSTSYYNSSSK